MSDGSAWYPNMIADSAPTVRETNKSSAHAEPGLTYETAVREHLTERPEKETETTCEQTG
jgi:hypothetical protein